MADAIRGKGLFEGLLDYPLPNVAGTRDYVFYFVPDAGYGKAARRFFRKFYRQHVEHRVVSLEQMVATLHADVTQHGVQHIRELVMVCHGTPLALGIPLPDVTNDDNMKSLNAYSMAVLQRQVLDGAHAAFRAQRAAVVSRLRLDSWVTVRACRFGQTDAGMYALYSFFGGNANVYAPEPYQLFGYQPIVEGMRFPDRLAVHRHLVSQRLLPKDVHTPDRQDAVVRALADPGAFSTPFALSSEALGGGGVPEYEGLVNALNAEQVSATLRTKLHDNGFDLTAAPKAKVVVPDTTWIVRDKITDAAASFNVEFGIGEQVDLTAATRTLLAQAQLPAAHSTSKTVPWQVFLGESEHDLYDGKAFNLAYARDDDVVTAANRVRFDALRALLEGNGAQGQTFGAGQIDLRADFAAQGRTLVPGATIAAEAPPPRAVWKVGPDEDGVSYLIKLEHSYVQVDTDQLRGVGWTAAQTLNVFLDLDEAALLRHRDEVLAYIGTDLDSPGVELAASMDRLSIDDLLDLITHLRAPYRPRNAIYLDQAQQAITRKADFEAWWRTRFPDPNQSPFPSTDPLTELSLQEGEDKKATIYDFRFGGNWAEVKASTDTPFAFQQDLFEEEPLARRFRIADTDLGKRDALIFDEDSPYTDVAELRALESLGLNQYFAIAEKQEFTAPAEAEVVSCADFRAAVMRVKDLSNAPVEQLAAALAGQTTPGGTSYLDIILELRKKYALLRNMVTLGGLSDIVKLPSIPDPTNAYDVAKTVAGFVAKRLEWEVGVAAIKYLGTIDVAVTVPWKLWWHFLDLQMEGVERWTAAGRIIGVRTWLRRLMALTREREIDFPDDVAFDLTVASSPNASYYMEAYNVEMDQAENTYNALRYVHFPDELKEGFDDGAAAMNRAWPTLRRYADEAANEVLRAQGLDGCRAQALIDAGFLEPRAIRAMVVRALAQKLLAELPHA